MLSIICSKLNCSIITSTTVHVFAAAGVALFVAGQPLMALERERMMLFWISGSNLKWNLCQTATGEHLRPFEFVNKTTNLSTFTRIFGFYQGLVKNQKDCT